MSTIIFKICVYQSCFMQYFDAFIVIYFDRFHTILSVHQNDMRQNHEFHVTTVNSI